MPTSLLAMKWRSEEVRVAGLEGVVAVAAASHEDRPRWFAVSRDGTLRGFDLDDGSTFFEPQKLPFNVEHEGGVTLVASPNGRYVAAVQTHGTEGALYDVTSQRLLKPLSRGDYHPEVSAWCIALDDTRLFLATDWNRVEVWSLPTCERLRPTGNETKYDYFYGEAELSPSKKWLASFGWHWHPIGTLNFIDVEAWLANGEGDDGRPPLAKHPLYAEWWDSSVCFLDDRRVALIGDARSEDDDVLQTQTGLLIYDFTTGARDAYFPGLLGHALAFDDARLILLGSETLRAISPLDGSVLATLEKKCTAWHPGNRTALSLEPLAQHWLVGTRTSAAKLELPRGASPAELSVLADALEEQGGDAGAIAHLRSSAPHGRRCHVIESLSD
ncbi:MAG: WD40 repeat domain-containing protein [Archangium sp.]